MAIGYIIGAVPLIVGIADFPAEGDVEKDVVYDDGAKTGTFKAPSEDDVEDGIGYGAGDTEFEGNLEIPAEADVEQGVTYGANGTEFTGTLVAYVFAGTDIMGQLEDDIDMSGELEKVC